ncbi:MAG: hypothetical protein ABEJ78_09065 [Haloferacaceae archaeon]
MRLGILETIGLATTLVFAIPVGVFAVETLLAGDRFLGGLLLLVAVLMVVLPRRLTTPEDVPAAVAEKTIGTAVEPPDEED